MVQENPAGALGQAGACAAGVGDGSAAGAARAVCPPGRAEAAEFADGPLSTPQPANAVTANAAASAAARRAEGGGRDIQWRATGREHTSSHARSGPIGPDWPPNQLTGIS
ncbi:MAG: hypothetical protein ACTHPS_17970 [Streptosporangiaceae bacterium]